MVEARILEDIARDANVEIVERVAKGTFADVFKVKKRCTGPPRYCAMKVINDIKKGDDEYAIHKMLCTTNNQHIIRLHAGKYCTRFYMIMDFGEYGTLRDQIEAGPIDINKIKLYFRQLITGLAFIHSKHVVHMDLKPANLFLTSPDRLKIGDFGLSLNIRDEERFPSVVYKTVQSGRGSLPFMSPENSRLGQWIEGMPCDIWSTGIILVYMLLGRYPWDTACTSEVEYNKWVNKKLNSQDGVHWDKIDAKTLKFLYKILEPIVRKRATIKDIKKNAWFLEKNIEEKSAKALKKGRAVSSALRQVPVPTGQSNDENQPAQASKGVVQKRKNNLKVAAYAGNSASPNDQLSERQPGLSDRSPPAKRIQQPN